MSSNGFSQFALCTHGGAFVQAVERASKSDRRARREAGPTRGASGSRGRRARPALFWSHGSRPVWAATMSIFVIALGLGLFSI